MLLELHEGNAGAQRRRWTLDREEVLERRRGRPTSGQRQADRDSWIQVSNRLGEGKNRSSFLDTDFIKLRRLPEASVMWPSYHAILPLPQASSYWRAEMFREDAVL